MFAVPQKAPGGIAQLIDPPTFCLLRNARPLIDMQRRWTEIRTKRVIVPGLPARPLGGPRLVPPAEWSRVRQPCTGTSQRDPDPCLAKASPQGRRRAGPTSASTLLSLGWPRDSPSRVTWRSLFRTRPPAFGNDAGIASISILRFSEVPRLVITTEGTARMGGPLLEPTKCPVGKANPTTADTLCREATTATIASGRRHFRACGSPRRHARASDPPLVPSARPQGRASAPPIASPLSGIMYPDAGRGALLGSSPFCTVEYAPLGFPAHFSLGTGLQASPHLAQRIAPSGATGGRRWRPTRSSTNSRLITEKRDNLFGAPGSRPAPVGIRERRIVSLAAESLRRQNVRTSSTEGLLGGKRPPFPPLVRHTAPRPKSPLRHTGPDLSTSLSLPI